MTSLWRAPHDARPRGEAPIPTPRGTVDGLLEAAYAENGRADGKSAALLTIVGIGFTAFAAAGAVTVAAPLRGPAQWLAVAALVGVCAVAELLLLALRPTLGRGLAGQRYFATWCRYEDIPARLAAELNADPGACRTLIDVSRIVWRKYLLIRWAIDLLLVIVPGIAAALAVALLVRLLERDPGGGQRAVTRYRQLAQDSPDAYLRELAGSLTNLATCLSGMGLGDQAENLFTSILGDLGGVMDWVMPACCGSEHLVPGCRTS